jgi:hypothetical protein
MATIARNGVAMPHTSPDVLACLAEQGARFALPQRRRKRPFYDGWPNKPFGLEQASDDTRQGGNVGLLIDATSVVEQHAAATNQERKELQMTLFGEALW